MGEGQVFKIKSIYICKFGIHAIGHIIIQCIQDEYVNF